MARLRALDLAKPFVALVPDVDVPVKRVEQMERLLFTGAALFFFAVISELPLYTPAGSAILTSPDPLWSVRVALGGSRGTPAEFGILPLVLSGAIFQISAGLRHFSVNLDLRSDRVLFQSAQKIVAVAIAVVLSAGFVISGSYSSGWPVTTQLLTAVQLVLGTVSLLAVDEVLSRGYGIGSVALLLPVVRGSQEFAWAALSPVSVPSPSGPKTLGALPNLFWSLQGRSFKWALVSSTFRPSLPTLLDVIVPAIAFLATVWVSTLRLELPIRSTRMRAQASGFPVRLMYTGSNPLLFTAATLAAFLSVSATLFPLAPDNLAVRLIGAWAPEGSRLIATSGVAYYVTPPLSLSAALRDPVRVLSFVGLWVTASAWFSHAWQASSGFAAPDVAKMFKENSIVLLGKRDVSVARELRRVIPVAAAAGGAVLGGLVAVTDVTGRPGWGSPIVVAACGLLGLFEILGQEGMAGPGGFVNQQLGM